MSKLFWAMLALLAACPVLSRYLRDWIFEQYSRGIVIFPFIGWILGG